MTSNNLFECSTVSSNGNTISPHFTLTDKSFSSLSNGSVSQIEHLLQLLENKSQFLGRDLLNVLQFTQESLADSIIQIQLKKYKSQAKSGQYEKNLLHSSKLRYPFQVEHRFLPIKLKEALQFHIQSHLKDNNRSQDNKKLFHKINCIRLQ